MIIDYIKLNPTENTTLLVKTPVPRKLQGAIAAKLLEAIGGEQVGYIEAASDPRAAARLQMMGGEFCGNATMSLGAVLAREAGLADDGSAALTLEVSGSDALVPCRIVRKGGAWVGSVQMPLPTAIRQIEVETDAGKLTIPLVEMPGIAHLILSQTAQLDEAQLRRRLPEWNARLGADALGALVWDEAASAIDPLVYVPSAGTLVRERGCGSGSAAVGSLLAVRAGHSLKTAVRQPGGIIQAEAVLENGMLTGLAITGRVEFVEEGTVAMEV